MRKWSDGLEMTDAQRKSIDEAQTSFLRFLAREHETHEIWNQYRQGRLGDSVGFDWAMMTEEREK